MIPAAELQDAERAAHVLAVDAGAVNDRDDLLAVEEPLQIRIAGGPDLVTMRTPGHDLELVAGLLLSEGLIRGGEDLRLLAPCEALEDVVLVELEDSAPPRQAVAARMGLISSACGVCGKTQLDRALLQGLPPLPPTPNYSSSQLLALPARICDAQRTFLNTGGLHAAALFDAAGELVALWEDVGRHNALDKLIGWALLEQRLPLHGHALLLSGRTSYELVQKSVMAGIALVCSVSAPSSYAVALAREFGVTLVGFLRDQRFNVYSHPERLSLPAISSA